MIRENYCDGRTHEEHCAWLDGLSDDESTIVHASIGIRYTFVMIAKTKALLLDDMPVGYRLRFLEWLNGCVDDRLTAAALAAVDPACPTALKMIDEMEPLGSNKALDLMASHDVFRAFCELNPSLLTAIRICYPDHPRQKRSTNHAA